MDRFSFRDSGFGRRFSGVVLATLFLATGLWAQDDLVLTNCPPEYTVDESRDILKLADQMPSWRGCEVEDFLPKREKCTAERVAEYVKENLVYPDRAKEMYLEGEVWIKFIVEQNGCLSNIAISRTLGGHTGWEAQKLVRGMPPWNSGVHKGGYAAVEVHIPIKFELPPD